MSRLLSLKCIHGGEPLGRNMCTYHEVDLFARVPLLDVHHGILNAIKIEVQRTGGLERACPMPAPILGNKNSLIQRGVDFSAHIFDSGTYT